MFIPKRILFEKEALNYEAGKRIYFDFLKEMEVEIIELKGNKIMENIPGNTLCERYLSGKRTLVVGVKKGMNFQTCKPSAHYQLPLVSGCIGQCQYCYLNTNLGDKPYVRVNVNIDEILNQAETYINQRLPEVTLFEGSATSDPVPVEPYTNALRQTILFFADNEKGLFRFVTKFTDVDSLLELKHNHHTEIRFTLNTDRVIKDYEIGTPSLARRLEACKKVIEAGYPAGFLIAPVFIYENWKKDYHGLLEDLSSQIAGSAKQTLSFEVISHRYTARAKNVINEIFPDNQLPMKDEERKFKYGQFGYGKYIYPKESLNEISEFFQNEITALFPNAEIKYVI